MFGMDPRLNPGYFQYQAEVRAEADQIMAGATAADLDLSGVLADRILNRLVLHRENGELPTAGTALQESLLVACDAILGGDVIADAQAPVTVAACRLLGLDLGAIVRQRFAAWEQVSLAIIDHGEAFQTFTETVSPILAEHLEELVANPTCQDPTSLLRFPGEIGFYQTFDDLRQMSLPAVLSAIMTMEQASPDLGPELAVRCELIGQIGAAAWVEWARRLPIPLMQVAAASHVRDLDEAEALLSLVLGGHDTGIETTTLGCALVVDTLALYAEVGFALRDQEAAGEWTANELPRHAATVAHMILDLGGSELAVACLSTRLLGDNSMVMTALRQALILAIAEGSQASSIVSALLAQRSLRSFVSGLSVMRERPDLHECEDEVLEAYSALLRLGEVSLAAQVDFDALSLLAESVVRSADPVACVSRLIVNSPSGWGDIQEQLSENSMRTACGFIVSAQVAAQLAHLAKVDQSRAVFSYAWGPLQQWLRRFDGEHRPETVLAVVSVWSVLPIVHPAGYSALALDGLARLDLVAHVLAAARSLRSSLIQDKVADGLDDTLKAKVLEMYCREYPILERRHNSSELLPRYVSILNEIVPGAQC